MKGLLLSGGKGVRLRPITHTMAKQLIPIANKPILFYCLEELAEAGIEDVGIIVGDTKEEIKRAVGDGAQWGLKATYIEQEAPLGLAHAVKIAEDYLGGEPFVMFLGDNILTGGIVSFVEEFEKERPNALILLCKVREPERFGVATLVGGRVVKLEEKPEVPASDLALVGVYIFDKNIFEAVNNIESSWRGELEITDAIQYLIDAKLDVRAHKVSGWWKDTGKLEDLLEANRIILDLQEERIEGDIDSGSKLEWRVVIEGGAKIEGSTIRGPAIVGKNSRISNSYVGPFTSIYHDVIIENSELENSIILEGSRILDVTGRIENSLIGKGVVIHRRLAKPSVYNFMVGDYSEIVIV